MQTNNVMPIVTRQLVLLFLCGSIYVFTQSFRQPSIQSKQQLFPVGFSAKQGTARLSLPYKGKFTIDLNANLAIGEATHLGRFTSVTTSSDGVFPDINSTTTTTAANGDELFTTDLGYATYTGNGMFDVNITCTIVGGTGRFATASGSYQTHAVINAALGTGTATFEGSINY